MGKPLPRFRMRRKDNGQLVELIGVSLSDAKARGLKYVRVGPPDNQRRWMRKWSAIDIIENTYEPVPEGEETRT